MDKVGTLSRDQNYFRSGPMDGGPKVPPPLLREGAWIDFFVIFFVIFALGRTVFEIFESKEIHFRDISLLSPVQSKGTFQTFQCDPRHQKYWGQFFKLAHGLFV